MDAPMARKRSHSQSERQDEEALDFRNSSEDENEPSTDIKLAILASLHPECSMDALMEVLLGANGDAATATKALDTIEGQTRPALPLPPKKDTSSSKVVGYQSSISAFTDARVATPNSPKKVTKRGHTLHLYSPEDVAAHTPCSIIHNFLAPQVADALLNEMLPESATWTRDKFMLFDNVVESPHTICFYVDDFVDAEKKKIEYVYNGSSLSDVRKSLPEMRKVSKIVEETVNEAIQQRIKSHYPDGKKLRFQSADKWTPNTSFVNCYDGGKESVGWHSDQLTYLGPRPVIGSISMGVAREFRVRRVVPRATKFNPLDKAAKKANDERADSEGQISIHLPHNSLLIMHAEMQEEWKHSIAPAQSIDPHPIARNKRINITYRCYRECFAPKHTPKCQCGVQAVLRCVQKKEENRGKYMWMCHAGYTPGQKGCSYFEWANFNDDGEPTWWKDYLAQRAKDPNSATR